MKKQDIESILNDLLQTGGDFAEVFIEEKLGKEYEFVDHKLDNLRINLNKGIGLRLAKNENVYYGATDNFSKDNLGQIIADLNKNINDSKVISDLSLNDLVSYKNECVTHYTDDLVKEKFKNLDELIRSKDKRIVQVNIRLSKNLQTVTIANHTGLYQQEERIHSRIYITINFKDGALVSNASFSKGVGDDFDFLDDIDFTEVINELIQEGIDKLYAKPCIGREMPVIIGNGFGGVIFHEACGHAMEATSVAPNASVLSGLLNEQIATKKVNITDDGTIKGEWGTNKIDDEGHLTQKNILIENGVLKSYLVDELNSKIMNHPATGSSRRESYLYPPTSRMNNTYLEAGTDTFADMIKDIKLGLYAKKLGGGSVSTESGDFNFACNLAYMIRDGKIAECVKSASLIGNTKDILQKVEMVGSDLELGPGVCGSISGYVKVNVGQPTIKISSILVGGENEE